MKCLLITRMKLKSHRHRKERLSKENRKHKGTLRTNTCGHKPSQFVCLLTEGRNRRKQTQGNSSSHRHISNSSNFHGSVGVRPCALCGTKDVDQLQPVPTTPGHKNRWTQDSAGLRFLLSCPPVERREGAQKSSCPSPHASSRSDVAGGDTPPFQLAETCAVRTPPVLIGYTRTSARDVRSPLNPAAESRSLFFFLTFLSPFSFPGPRHLPELPRHTFAPEPTTKKPRLTAVPDTENDRVTRTKKTL